MRRRSVFALGAGVLALAAGCGTADPPVQSEIAFVVPGPSGGQNAAFARVMKELIEHRRWAHKVGVSARPGGGGTLAIARFVAAGRQGDLMVADPALVSVAVMDRAAPIAGSTWPLARLAGQWEVLVASPSSRFRTFDDFAAALLRDPAGPKVAGGAAGGPDHLLYGLTAQGLGADTRLLDYASFPTGAQAVEAIVDGRVALGFGCHRDVVAHIRAGRLRPLAVSASERIEGVDAPTLVESGVRLVYANWWGLLASRRLGQTQRDALLALCQAIGESNAWGQACARNGWTPMLLAGDDFRMWLEAEAGRTDKLLGDLGLL
ncbi:Bug family tripartite tricarboxylate transporter substrate binding protein [Planotetraspora kaengkrachanensis]|uniref:C4-dicarboxylate ABC transporter substrate-binding protein n=1 Tax=Planotetraspora kaengkrachanensis TaxID=575193 RepID=A0A8J3PV17_9ACTN|nr:tripartite tricarboxylate transporter substrate-binding protein [Planotetraspora kaengkrachanensis]GIG81498.1 C4-dicarboxylate ABC transporter substrate-binding protein [Planotetraspora kaengkrachanensis]